MIFKSSFPNAPDVAVVISGRSVDYSSIQSVSVSIAENQHDIASISFTGLIPKGITDYIGAPVYISIATSPAQVATFYGYVAYLSPEAQARQGLVNNSPFQNAQMICFGASYDMKAQKNRSWDNVSLPVIVETLASTYKYSYSVFNDPFIWTRLVQSKQSDWEFLANAVKALGYGMTINGTHIHVYDPHKAISRQLPYVELKTLRGAENSPQYVPGRIMEFTGTFGDITPDGTSSDFEYIGLDNTGDTVRANSSEEHSLLGEKVTSRFTHQIGTNITSVAMLKKFAEASGRVLYPYSATVTTTGIAEPVPNSVAKIDNYDSNFDGYWLIKEVTHTVTRSNYITELKLVTDSLSTTPPTIRPGAAYETPPPPKLNTLDRWESSKEYNNVYV